MKKFQKKYPSLTRSRARDHDDTTPPPNSINRLNHKLIDQQSPKSKFFYYLNILPLILFIIPKNFQKF